MCSMMGGESMVQRCANADCIGCRNLCPGELMMRLGMVVAVRRSDEQATVERSKLVPRVTSYGLTCCTEGDARKLPRPQLL